MKNFSIALCTLFVLLILSLGVSAQLKGWGSNERGKLGMGMIAPPQPDPQNILAVPEATGVYGNFQHTIFLMPNGRLYSSGDNSLGQLGNQNVTDMAQMTPGPAAYDFNVLNDVIQVSAGNSHSVAVTWDGNVWSWGLNNNGQFGNGTTSTSLACMCIPFPIKALVADAVQVKAGTNFSVALLANGTVWVWGRNDYGQVGNGTTTGSEPQPVQNTTLSGIVQISAGSVHSVALKKDGTIWTWGQNSFGQAGNGTFSDEGCQCLMVPQQNTLIMNPVEIEAFHFGTFTRQSDGSIWAWGRNLEGTIGNGTQSGTGCQCQPFPAQTSVGTGNALLGSGFSSGYASIPAFSTPTGINVIRYGKSASFVFHYATSAGTISYSAIDPATTGLNIPAGYTIQNRAPAYNVTSTGTAQKKYVCLNVSTEYDPSEFALLKVLHEEGPDLVDRTASSVFLKRQVCAEMASSGRFVVAKGTVPTPNQLTVSGRLTDANGQGVANAVVFLVRKPGNQTRQTQTNAFGYYSFNSVNALDMYEFLPSAKRHRFPNPNFTMVGNLTDLNFTAQ